MAFKFAPAPGQAGSAAGGAGPLPGPESRGLSTVSTVESRPGVSTRRKFKFSDIGAGTRTRRFYLVREKGHHPPAAVWYEIAVKLSLHVRIDKEK